jgi:hypothetical protein
METHPIVEGDDAPHSVDIGDFDEIPTGMKWSCISCGLCCGNVFSESWLDLYVTEYVGPLLDGYCKHLDRENGNRCSIYQRRPNICRGYPFVIKKNGTKYNLTIHRRCNGIGHGQPIDIKEKLMNVLNLVEDDLSIEFIVEMGEWNEFSLYKIK